MADIRTEADIGRIGEAFRAATLPKAEWTHAAHFAAALWLIARCPDVAPERDMPAMIRRYNDATGTVNSDTSGYHETITQASLRATRAFLAGRPADEQLHATLAALMASPLGGRDWPFAYWSRDVLMSAQARREWVEPDVRPQPW